MPKLILVSAATENEPAVGGGVGHAARLLPKGVGWRRDGDQLQRAGSRRFAKLTRAT